MFKVKKIKFSLLFIIALSSGMVILAIFLSIFFISSIELFRDVTTKINEKSIHEQATYLLLKNIESSAQYYGSIFNKAKISSRLIAEETGKLYDLYKNDLMASTDFSKLHLKKTVNDIYYNNFTYNDIGVFIFNKDQSDSELTPTEVAGCKKTALYLLFGMKGLIISSAERTLFMHDYWVAMYLDRYYTAMYPNTLSGLDSKSAWSWNQGSRLVKLYMKQAFNENINSGGVKTFWSSIHYSMKKLPLITAITPIISNDDGVVIGITGATLRVETILNKIMGSSTTPKYEFGILDKSKKYDKYAGAFSFIINEKKELIAFPPEKCKLLGLHTDKSNGRKGFSGYMLTDSSNVEIKALAELMRNSFSGTMTISLGGYAYIFAYSKLGEDWSLCTVLPEYEVLSSVRNSNDLVRQITRKIVKDIIIITFVLLCISVIISLLFFNKYLFRPIVNLVGIVKNIGKGNFNVRLNLKGTVEVEELGRTFNSLSKQLKDYEHNLKKEITQRQAIETEVKVAGDIQASLLPKITEKFMKKNFSLTALLDSAKDASGDFYDFFYIREDILVVLIADVSGKGISAAFFMALAKTLIKSICLQFRKDNPAEILTIANEVLNKNNSAYMFVTVFLGFYNIKTGVFTYSNAGHLDAFHLTSEGQCRTFGSSSQMVLGVVTGMKYTLGSINLYPGEKIILYTDGVTEALNSKDEEYGLERLNRFILKNKKVGCEVLAKGIVDDVIKFENGVRFDDITILILERKL
jgi:serine phosphatase RsbU (regulator of sigma subunit)